MTGGHPYLDIAAVQRTCPGEIVCGDAIQVSATPNRTLIAVADGLGHGSEAKRAAQAFCDALVLEEVSLVELLRHAHSAIAGTRGVVAMVLRFHHDEGTLHTVGVGNIECHAVSRCPIHPISTPGIVGHNLRRVTEHSYRTASGDWFAIVSDGISTRTDFQAYRTFEPQQAAELIVQNHSRSNDDSSCVVVRIR